MASTKVEVTWVEEGVALVRMNDPEERNLLTDMLVDELMAALRELSADAKVKAAILCGRRDVFCGGGSLEMLRAVAAGATHAKDVLLPAMLVEFPVPIIAALEGHAVGAGLAMALWCDIVVASERARYGANFTSMGFTPGLGITALLPALVGYGFATEMMMTAKLYKGRELAERRLFTHVVPEGEVLDLAVDIARRIAERPRHVLTMLKAEIALPRRGMLTNAMPREHVMHQVCFSRPEARVLLEEGYVGPRSGAPERGTES
ncbi:polyketide synthase [Polyangium aurulentum]|uniref:polyketide synthase n=1 Tax=Polyangium aurulentum TaxID=2567896 RepID=UPI0010ADAAC0|nr:polyketide synthase [Polyangium aurulentum]UQA57005.1 enoyl-CoA hydratase/isomerase family protein [Polyangium aurulentum]